MVNQKNDGTQMCTVDIDSVRDMALEYMNKTFIYRGREFNMNKIGWTFGFSNKKRALGTCHFKIRHITISQWIVENGEREMKMWVNTIIHEISHAINHILGGRGHDGQWRDIFISLGGNGKRTSNDITYNDLVKKPVSKYTTICPNGHARPSHKLSSVINKGHRSCGKCSDTFDKRFLLKQIKNY